MYYGYRLRADNTLLYEITRGRGRRWGRLYHISAVHGISAPITFHFHSYRSLGFLELLKDVPRVIAYEVDWLVFTRLWVWVSTKVRNFYWRKRF